MSMYTLKYAVLDTDFISKALNIKDKENNNLADLLFSKTQDDFIFCCHQMLQEELSTEKTKEQNEWLKIKKEEQKVLVFKDQDMLLAMQRSKLQDDSPISPILEYLNYFEEISKRLNGDLLGYYQQLKSAYISSNNLDAFSFDLEKVDKIVKLNHKDIGEIKAYILLKVLLHYVAGNNKQNNVYLFCSEDQYARLITSKNSEFQCLSLLASFQILKERGVGIEEASPYYNSFIQLQKQSYNVAKKPHLATLYDEPQMKVWIFEKNCFRKTSMTMQDIFKHIYKGNFKILSNGELLYYTSGIQQVEIAENKREEIEKKHKGLIPFFDVNH